MDRPIKMNAARTSGLGGPDDNGVHMYEPIEPLASTAGIDRAVAEKPTSVLLDVVRNLDVLRNIGSHHQPHRPFDHELFGLGRNQIATDPMDVAAQARGA